MTDRFFKLLREDKFNVVYDTDYNPQWTNDETHGVTQSVSTKFKETQSDL